MFIFDWSNPDWEKEKIYIHTQINSLQVKPTAQLGALSDENLAFFHWEGQERGTFLSGSGRPRGAERQVPEKNIWLAITKERNTCRLLLCLLCDWLSILHTHTKICFGAGNRLFVPRKSGVIRQPVYLGRLPILAGAGRAEPSGFGTDSCLAPRFEMSKALELGMGEGALGERSVDPDLPVSGCSPDITDSPAVSSWQAFPFLRLWKESRSIKNNTKTDRF